jgi:hypothetical protein
MVDLSCSKIHPKLPPPRWTYHKQKIDINIEGNNKLRARSPPRSLLCRCSPRHPSRSKAPSRARAPPRSAKDGAGNAVVLDIQRSHEMALQLIQNSAVFKPSPLQLSKDLLYLTLKSLEVV